LPNKNTLPAVTSAQTTSPQTILQSGVNQNTQTSWQVQASSSSAGPSSVSGPSTSYLRNRVLANFAADAVVHRAVFGATASHAETHRERRQDCYPDLSYCLSH
jgi:hypothetical protein